MITYTITGRTLNFKRYNDFVAKVVSYLLPYPYKRDIEIEINIIPQLESGNYGECLGDRNGAEIYVARKDQDGKPFSEEDMAYNIAHELVHAKQFIKGQLNGNTDKWKGAKWVTKATIQPWEREAYAMEVQLTEMFFIK
jgi:hypothetical protein